MTRLVVIAGPTAAGKSAAAMRVANAVGGEIINADSVQLYRHFDIGSAKPTTEMRKAVPHHLIDILDPNQPFSLWDYNHSARSAIANVASRGKLPILCGGTGLYIKAVLEDLKGGARPDEALRAELSSLSNEELFSRLQNLNPLAAEKIHPNDTYRLLRGVENASIPQPAPVKKGSEFNATYFVLSSSKTVIYERIGARVDKMFSAGWINETRAILETGFSPDCKPFKSVGYRQIVEHLSGRLSYDKLTEEVKKVTRNYAKRQMTWFYAVNGTVRLEADEKAANIIINKLEECK
ncbi:MAG: tRNA (adenosine(37)-N6)-dimethylallyltransferase MiaA [Nitrospinae bacterium]|nr:tRNA (adenosine(37)-N6)-dimethylallyltransferase MiaA [Nitrospinota bacterium]